MAKVGRIQLTDSNTLGRIFLFVNVEAFDDGLPRGAVADVLLYSFNKSQGERRRLFVGAG
jgi:hypothetical protein